MPAGKYSFYLHSDDQVDLAAARAVDNISQPLRGDFLRTVAAAGSVMYRLDSRLPVILADLFDGQLRAANADYIGNSVAYPRSPLATTTGQFAIIPRESGGPGTAAAAWTGGCRRFRTSGPRYSHIADCQPV